MTEESISRDIILQLLHDSIDEVNAQFGRERQVGKVPDTSLVIGAGGLDSLAYINIITTIEDRCEQRFGRFVGLGDDGAKGASYQTISELADCIVAKLRQ